MKQFATLIIATLLVALAGSAGAEQAGTTGPDYTYVVSMPEAKAPIVLQMRQGEEKSQQVSTGRVVEYTQQMASMPRSVWMNTPDDQKPAHDFVECGAKDCWYGTKMKLADESIVKIRLDADATANKPPTAEVRYTRQHIDNVRSAGMKGAPAFPLPETSTYVTHLKVRLKVGETVSLGEGATLRLVAAD